MRGGIKGFIEGVIREMRRVVWPSWQETTRLTLTVLIVCVVFVLYLYLASYIVDIALKAAEGQSIKLG
jgi:preprotein translocase SecE subunit